jgi:hypothetical protein
MGGKGRKGQRSAWLIARYDDQRRAAEIAESLFEDDSERRRLVLVVAGADDSNIA